MSWHNPDSKWQCVLRRRVFVLRVLGATVFGASLILAIVMSLSVRGTDADVLPIVLVVLLTSNAIILAGIWHTNRMTRTVAKLVPKHDGHVCRKCRTPLPRETSEGQCSKCGTSYERSELQSYWVDYVLDPLATRSKVVKDSWFERQIGSDASIKTRIRASVVIWALIVLGTSLFMQRSVIAVVIRNLPLFFVLCFSQLCAGSFFAYRRRTGQSRFCAECGYQFAPTGDNAHRCPECGSDWSGLGGTVVGTQAGNSRHLWTGIAWLGLMIAMIAIDMRSVASQYAWVTQVQPTSSLIYDAIDNRGRTTAQWKELGRRQLSPKQEHSLAVGLLDKRLRENFLDKVEGGWLWNQVSTASLPEDLIDRYYSEMLEVWIDVPESIMIGEQLPVGLGSTYRHSSQPKSINGVICFGGFYFGDDPNPIARKETCMYAMLLDDPQYGIHADATPSQSGRLRVRAVFYYAIGPFLNWAKMQAIWNDDGTATLPAEVIWSRRIELEAFVDVQQKD